MQSMKFVTFLLVFQLSACANNATNVNNSTTPLTGNFVFERNPQNNTVSYIKDNNPNLSLTSASDGQSLQDISLNFLQSHRTEFLLANPKEEFNVSSVKKDDLGFTRLKLNQRYKGIPVLNGIISMQFNRQNILQLVKGQYFPTPAAINPAAGLSHSELFTNLGRLNPSISQNKYKTQKVIFYKNNIEPILAYKLVPLSHTNLVGNELVVDAINGTILNRMSSIQTLR